MYQAPYLHQAVHRRNMDEVKRLISGTEVDVTFLHRTGSNPRAIMNSYWKDETPLHVACKHGYVEIAAFLIKSGSDVEGRTGSTPLHLAAANGHYDVVNLLLMQDVDIDKRAFNGATPLWRAANSGHARIVLRLIGMGANVNLDARVEERRMTPLQTACNEGHLAVADILLSAACKLDTQDTFGRTALHYASDMGFPDIIQLLLDAGANPNIIDRQGYYPLHAATSLNNIDVIKVLGQNGHDVNAGSETFNGTAVHLAVTFQFDEPLKALIEVGADLDAVDSSKYTALYLSCQTAIMKHETWLSIVTLLIQAGSDLNYTLPITNSILECAVSKQLWEVVRLLLRADCQVSSRMLQILSRCPEEIRVMIEDRLCVPSTMKAICRQTIREHIRRLKLWPLSGVVSQLPLPKVIQNYIAMMDIVSYEE